MNADAPAGTDDRKALRKAKRAQRRALTGQERRNAEAAIVGQIGKLRQFRAARRIGTFIAFDGEPDLSPLPRRFPGPEFYVPVIDDHAMRFAAMPDTGQRRSNFFGIAEPRNPSFVPAATLDIVLTPLVAFDTRGVRLGVGRGYYDRCFEFLRTRRYWLRPRLLGVAFECQLVPEIQPNAWDVPLWGAVTERGLRIFT